MVMDSISIIKELNIKVNGSGIHNMDKANNFGMTGHISKEFLIKDTKK
jgi:hypothetical protein